MPDTCVPVDSELWQPRSLSRYSELATGWTTDKHRFDSQRVQIYHSSQACGPDMAPIYCVAGAHPRVERPVRLADSLPPSTSQVQGDNNYISTTLHTLTECTWTIVECEEYKSKVTDVSRTRIFNTANNKGRDRRRYWPTSANFQSSQPASLHPP
jgi:hypothetical protein